MGDNDGRPTGRRRASRTGGNSVPRGGIRDEVVIFHVPEVGKVLAVLPVVPENAPYRVREGIARRRLVAITGTCPCGAQFDHRVPPDGGPAVEVEHEDLCPAVTDRLVKAIRRWQR
jgi:hypothetical protein